MKLKQEFAIINGLDSIVFGVRILINASQATSEQAVEFIQEHLYEDIGASGNFRLMPNDASLISADYVVFNTKNLPEDFCSGAVSTLGNSTVVTLLLSNHCFESVEEELNAFTHELNEMVANGYAVKWDVLNINPKCLELSFELGESSVYQQILIKDDSLDKDTFVQQLESGEIGTSLDYSPYDTNEIYNTNLQPVGEIILQSIHGADKVNFKKVA